MIGKLPWGLDLDLKPFFGIMAVAPPAAWGMINSPPPRRNGGNMDNKELVAGTTLYLPIHTDGALFSCGDGHGVQGDGEVCITAIETGLIGTFELIVRDDMAPLEWPMAETPTHVMTMAFDPDLDDCVVIALRDMIKLICARTGISREDAYTLCSLAADLRVTQVVNGAKGIHVMLEKKLLQKGRCMSETPALFSDGKAYERFMGRWSRLAGDIFLDWLDAPKGLRWLDVGCGNGAFTEVLISRTAPAEVTGIDPSEGQTRLCAHAARREVCAISHCRCSGAAFCRRQLRCRHHGAGYQLSFPTRSKP